MTLLERRDRLKREYGPWQDKMPLGEGVFTLPEPQPGADERVAAILQVAADILGSEFAGARILDVGAAEGLFSVEFARHGAEVLALEPREGNVQKTRFVADALGLSNLEVVKDDVRELSAERYGQFDLVLCLGLLYHLDAGGAVLAAQNVADVSNRAAVVDTHIAFRARTSVCINGRAYSGIRQREFDPSASKREQERLSRSAIGNPESFWPTLPSLYNLLSDAGFTSQSEVVWPRHPKTADRVTLIAFRGSHVRPLSHAHQVSPQSSRWPERERRRPHPNQGLMGQIRRHIGPLLPAALKEFMRRRRERPR